MRWIVMRSTVAARRAQPAANHTDLAGRSDGAGPRGAEPGAELRRVEPVDGVIPADGGLPASEDDVLSVRDLKASSRRQRLGGSAPRCWVAAPGKIAASSSRANPLRAAVCEGCV